MSRRFLITLGVLWVAGGIAGPIYFQRQDIATAVAWAAGLAVLLEASQYASLAFEETRSRWGAVTLVAMAPASYFVYAAPSGVFTFASLGLILVGAALATAWFRVLPRNKITDICFIVLMASPLLFKGFAAVYQRPAEGLRLEVLGQLVWIRLGVLAVLHARPQRGIHFGFVPGRAEWKAGLAQGVAALAVVLPLAAWLGFARLEWPGGAWWETAGAAAGTFLGILWVVALSEEFFFRGLLQQWFEQWWGRAWLAVGLASMLFGLAHLGFRAFPNWEFALLAAVAGVFYGLAFRAGGGVRAAMVAHALVVTVWRVAFR